MEISSGEASASRQNEMAESVFAQGIKKALGMEELLSRISQATELKRRYLAQLRTKISERERSALYSNQLSEEITLPYGFKKENDSRSWIKDAFLEEKDCGDVDSDAEVTEQDYREMLKLHHLKRKCNTAVSADASLSMYMHYSSDFVTNEDKWPSHQKVIKRMKKKKKVKREEKMKREGSVEHQDLGHESGSKDHEHVNSQKNASTSQTPQPKKKKQLNIDAIRKRHWKMIAKKDIPKAYRVRIQFRSNSIALLRRVSRESMKKQRAISALSVKTSKDKAGRARRITREMQLFWKKYSKVEKVHRKKAEKHALEQIRLDEEMREAKRQQRKLNFLISQTELFAHFISKKLSKAQDGVDDERMKAILDTLKTDYTEDETSPSTSSLSLKVSDAEDHDGAYYCDKAMRNVKEAITKQRSQTASFDDSADGRAHFSDSYSLVNPSISADEDIPQPKLFKGVLKTYQLKGMNWLRNLYEQGINGILADEMGLGKTVQTIAFFGHLAEKVNIWGPFLVVAPASTLNNWHQEFTKFFPDFKVLPYWGNPVDRKVLRKFWNQKASYHSDRNSAPFHVLVTSYQLVISDVRYFQRIKWQYMVLDEAQALKSTASVRWKILLEFSCRNRLLLTGTPIQNTMAELWALLHFIMPSLFDSHMEFNEWFSKDIENHIENKSNMDETQLSRLHMILKPFMLRRIKRDVENELSEKIEVRVNCSLAPRQRKLYNAIKQNIKLEDLLNSTGCTYINTGSGNTLMNLVMQFRKVCNHPDLFERRDVSSPFCMDPLPSFSLPKLIFHEGILSRITPGRKQLLYCDLSAHHPQNIHESQSGFSFLRMLQMTGLEYWKIMTSGIQYQWWLVRNQIEAKKTQYFNNIFHTSEHTNLPSQSLLRSSRSLQFLVLTATLFPHFCTTSPFHQLLFATHFSDGYTHRDTSISLQSDAHCKVFERGLELLSMPKALCGMYIPPVAAPVCQIYCCDRSACNEFSRPVFGQLTASLLFGPSEGNLLRGEKIDDKISAAKQTVFSNKVTSGQGLTVFVPPCGWSYIRIPDKEYLVMDSGKLYALDILLRRLKLADHRVLIYSQMTRMIDILEEYMWYRRYSYIRLDGSSRISERRDMVADFQSRSDIFVFLLSTRAGGLGINLTAADTVIFYDSDWNPTVDQQAMDRAHRLGQTKQVTVYRLVCQGTVDERILQRAEEKSVIQRMVIAGGSFKPDTLKTKEVVSLLLDDEKLLQRLKMRREENKGEFLPYKGKKRGRKSNAEREVKRLKQLHEQGVTGTVADSSAGNVTIMHSESNSSVSSDLFEAKFMASSLNTSLDEDSESGSFFDSAPASPASDVSCGDLKVVEDDAIVVDDIPGDSPSPISSSRILHGRGRGAGRGRGRPRIRPLMPEPPRRRNKISAVRGLARGRRASRVRRIFTGRAAAMAGARAGAVAASAATYATYGYGLEPTSSILHQKDKTVSNPSSVT